MVFVVVYFWERNFSYDAHDHVGQARFFHPCILLLSVDFVISTNYCSTKKFQWNYSLPILVVSSLNSSVHVDIVQSENRIHFCPFTRRNSAADQCRYYLLTSRQKREK